MSIKLVKRGIWNPEAPRKEIDCKATCLYCKSEVEFTSFDGEYVECNEEGDFVIIPCPVCPNDIYHNMEDIYEQ